MAVTKKLAALLVLWRSYLVPLMSVSLKIIVKLVVFIAVFTTNFYETDVSCVSGVRRIVPKEDQEPSLRQRLVLHCWYTV